MYYASTHARCCAGNGTMLLHPCIHCNGDAAVALMDISLDGPTWRDWSATHNNICTIWELKDFDRSVLLSPQVASNCSYIIFACWPSFMPPISLVFKTKSCGERNGESPMWPIKGNLPALERNHSIWLLVMCLRVGFGRNSFLTRIGFRIVQLTSSNTFLRSCIGRAKCCLVECLLHDVNQLCMHMEHFQGFFSSCAISALLTSQCALAGWLQIKSVGYNFVNPLLFTEQSKVLKHFTFICAGSIVYSLWLWSCIFPRTTSSVILSLSHCPSLSGDIDTVLEQINT